MTTTRLANAVRTPKRAGKPALVSYFTAGHPTLEGFSDTLHAVARSSDASTLNHPGTPSITIATPRKNSGYA